MSTPHKLADGSVEFCLRWLKYHRNKPAQEAWARISGEPEFALAAADSAWAKLAGGIDTEVLTPRPTL
jgi:hypothetical protein